MYLEICRIFGIWCLCCYCVPYKYSQYFELFELDLKRKQRLKENMIPSSTLHDVPLNTTVQISSTPDVKYLLKSEHAMTISGW